MRQVKILIIDDEQKLEPLTNNTMSRLQENGCKILDTVILHNPPRNYEEWDYLEDKFDKYISREKYIVKIFYDDSPDEERFVATSDTIQLQKQMAEQEQQEIIASRY